ncbi:prephenate dehydratase [Helicobacter winghamensis]|uniref:Bifunctional chorismate mutase/prephenate dehydratase n=1 Tax=Helicobacter winghamensis TaxID=157268 RepID=A0A2N3PL68_9HELI|nr:prephenate dehydratase [Helicobacter winghamensis]EEO26748.1 chorismate mutase [Helicobacter winghamensis ATCC BAA-430]PKT79512.1 chorismate mutase [Helicobacter winghamensis]PKT79629.1 chorismate mutase [Helicobacter winghamensis]PKT79683.1 chorismate mutase [Helicobacter winghamensis]PKT82480.1 chorismate mutase [Helicobacter winghamensis]
MNLQHFRTEIDGIDDSILELLEKRMEIVKRIGKAKMQSNAPIYRPEREKEIIDRLNSKKSLLLDKSAIEAIYLEIFAVSRNLELPERVAYLGPLGSYTHQAAESRFGAMCEYFSHNTITQAIKSVENRRASYAVIPIENNQNGAVGETLDLLKDTELKIVAEIYMPIHHCFASIAQSVKEIEVIYSKDIAFGQCSSFLSEHSLDHIQRIPVDSTARAAQLAAENPKCAAICSHIAAKLYNVPVLFGNIEDNSHNKTRFIIVSNFKNQRCGRDKTSLYANLANTDRPGALYHLLYDIKDLNINMTSIQSRPVSGSDFNYCFFIDIDGHIDDANVAELFLRYPNALKWLGSYLKN